MSNKKKVMIKTYGCQMNEYDSQQMLSDLEGLDYLKTEDQQEADLILLNTCHIREKAAEKVYSELGRIKTLKEKNRNLKIGVTGCVAQAESTEIFKRQPAVDFVIGPQAYHKFPKIINELKKGKKELIETSFEAKEKFKKLKKGKTEAKSSAFITIQEGCDKFCTFCVVPYTRGKEVSRKKEDIVSEAETLVKKNVKEVILLGQNVNSYSSNGETLASLIEALSEIEKIERIRFMTSHPNDMTDELITIFGTNKKLMPFLHLPVQSGSDKILKLMNRKHTIKDYKQIISKLRNARDDICFSSDFIVGFPGETESDFEETLSLCEHVEFSQAYSFNYSSRPGTTASGREEIEDFKKKERLLRLQKLLETKQKAFLRNQLGKTVKVLFEKRGKNPNEYIGRSDYFYPVAVESNYEIIGEIKNVKVESCLKHSVKGCLLG
mgnify:CR=1 FL=1